MEDNNVELTEAELIERLKKIKDERFKADNEFLKNWLKERNYVIVTEVPIQIDGRLIQSVLQAL